MMQKRSFLFSIFVITATLFFLEKVTAQEAQGTRQSDAEFIAPKKKIKRPAPKKTEEEPVIKLDGSLTKAVKSQEPLQMVNPLAPASYGTGEKNVSEDPDEEGRPQGLLLFGIQW